MKLTVELVCGNKRTYRVVIDLTYVRIKIERIVLEFNSCTEYLDKPGIMRDPTPNWHPVSWAWI